MGAANFLALLRQLSQARPGDGVLYLPPGLSPQAAVQAVRAVLRALEPPRTRMRTRLSAKSGTARVYIDGAARGNPGPAGAGVLLMGADGEVLERIHRWIGEATNNVAEYRALLVALEVAEALGCTELEVASDSELLVRQLQGRYQVKNPVLKELYGQAKDRIARLRRFHIHHIPREENAEADRLANLAIDEALRSQSQRRVVDPAEGVGG